MTPVPMSRRRVSAVTSCVPRDQKARTSAEFSLRADTRNKTGRKLGGDPSSCGSVVEFVTRSAEETHNLGARLSQGLAIPSAVLLIGALGTGKTTLARGIAAGLGLDDPSLVTSPSFTLVNIYHGRCTIYHVDLYRLEGKRDIDTIGIDEFIDKDGITIVEWGERLLFPVEAALTAELEDAGGDSRIIRVIRRF